VRFLFLSIAFTTASGRRSLASHHFKEMDIRAPQRRGVIWRSPRHQSIEVMPITCPFLFVVLVILSNTNLRLFSCLISQRAAKRSLKRPRLTSSHCDTLSTRTNDLSASITEQTPHNRVRSLQGMGSVPNLTHYCNFLFRHLAAHSIGLSRVARRSALLCPAW
jgi:hypothetical protein